jgi:hypothetical protein
VAHNARWAPTARLGSMFGYGVGYAIASLSCSIAPFLAVTGATFQGGPLLRDLLIYLAYAAGFALIVGALAVAAAFASSSLVDQMRRILPYINRIGGLLLVLVGLYVAYYGFYEVRLLANGNPDDPVIAAAGQLQRNIAGWVHQHGGWPWIIGLFVVVVGAIIWGLRGRARR